ncbi:MAG: adenylate kinase [Pseudomonadota bacterium]|nr:adenylate kinase [Pseudomonadota bacterium]
MIGGLDSRGVLVLGAAGSGTSTLGSRLALRLGWRHVDLDTVLWAPTNPPFTAMNPPATRTRLLGLSLEGAIGWVLSGSPGAWSDFLVQRLLLSVFLQAPTALRVARLKEREARRHGIAIDVGNALHVQHEAFLAWAALYDEGPPEGRSLRRHEAWLASSRAPVLRLSSTHSVDHLLNAALAHPALASLGPDLGRRAQS